MHGGINVDILTNPFVIALLTLLGLPVVTSVVTTILRRVSDVSGIDPRAIVYVASVFVTIAVVLLTNPELPAFAGDPAVMALAWLAWVTSNAELARRLYEAVVSILQL